MEIIAAEDEEVHFLIFNNDSNLKPYRDRNHPY